MIKVGIAGADSPAAGELMRLCQQHPDIDIVTAYAPRLAGRPVSEVHHGFIGEERVLFSANFDATALDCVFLLQPLYSDSDWMKLMADRQELKLILFPNIVDEAPVFNLAPVYGLSGMNRKPLVRGARVATVPRAVASAALTALYPLANHLMLAGDLNIEVEAPADIISQASLAGARKEILNELQRVQTSFSGQITLTPRQSQSPRAMRLSMAIPCATRLDEVFKIYDSIYDDHNFSFMISRRVDTAEVEGTNKIVISLWHSADDTLNIDVVADPRMRGSAGEALHVMNLLFGLHEKTGLSLPATAWRGSENGDVKTKL